MLPSLALDIVSGLGLRARTSRETLERIISTSPILETTTSLQRTYRYLRVGIAATVGVIAVAVLVATVQMGELWSSISAYYYSAAQTLFVGALIAASLGIIALSGRGVERALLDAAGILAPLIAIIPTPITPGTVPGSGEPCPNGGDCTPTGFHEGITVGIVTYSAVGLALWIIAMVLTRPKAAGPRARSVKVSLVLSPVILCAVSILWLSPITNDFMLSMGHFAAAGVFFLLIAAVSIRSNFGFEGEIDPPLSVKRAYFAIGAVMFFDVVALIVIVVARLEGPDWFPFVLVGEFIALLAFCAFWILQSKYKWYQENPGLVS